MSSQFVVSNFKDTKHSDQIHSYGTMDLWFTICFAHFINVIEFQVDKNPYSSISFHAQLGPTNNISALSCGHTLKIN